jgi:hypothetical protein
LNKNENKNIKYKKFFLIRRLAMETTITQIIRSIDMLRVGKIPDKKVVIPFSGTKLAGEKIKVLDGESLSKVLIYCQDNGLFFDLETRGLNGVSYYELIVSQEKKIKIELRN